LTHQWFLVLFRAAVLLVRFAICDAGTGFALSAAVRLWRIDVHIVYRSHSNGDTRLDMAVRGNLLIHGLVFRFRNALAGNRW
jgi:hypothetical protein